jgi:hypothetical protein
LKKEMPDETQIQKRFSGRQPQQGSAKLCLAATCMPSSKVLTSL